MEELALLLSKRIGNNPSSEKINAFAESQTYLCRMYWQQRTDKLSSNDFDFYRQLTNHCCAIHNTDRIADDFTPLYGNNAILSNYNHQELAEQVRTKIISIMTPKQNISTSLFNFLSWFKK